MTALIADVFPLERFISFAAESGGKPEKRDLSIDFIPITCATPIIMAEPLGFYKKYGLNASVKRGAGWAMIRDWAINGEVDAAHMLTPMPLAISLGAAPTIVNGLRISFGSALVSVVPAEMLLGELGVGYLSWIEWNNLDISGVIFAILVVGCVGVILDAGFNKLAGLVTYQE